MTDIDALSAMQYAEGADTITVAVAAVRPLVYWATAVAEERVDNPTAFPGFPRNVGTDYWARRIVAALIEAGWTPPDQTSIDAAAKASRERSEWFEANQHKPCSCGHDHAAHSGEGDRCVDCQHIDGTECWTWNPEQAAR